MATVHFSTKIIYHVIPPKEEAAAVIEECPPPLPKKPNSFAKLSAIIQRLRYDYTEPLYTEESEDTEERELHSLIFEHFPAQYKTHELVLLALKLDKKLEGEKCLPEFINTCRHEIIPNQFWFAISLIFPSSFRDMTSERDVKFLISNPICQSADLVHKYFIGMLYGYPKSKLSKASSLDILEALSCRISALSRSVRTSTRSRICLILDFTEILLIKRDETISQEDQKRYIFDAIDLLPEGLFSLFLQKLQLKDRHQLLTLDLEIIQEGARLFRTDLYIRNNSKLKA